MTPKERAAMELALEALESVTELYDDNAVGVEIEAITALREALAEQAEQEPVATVVRNKFGVISLQAPNGDNFNLGKNVGMKLYAAPVRTKDMTDAELRQVLDKHCGDGLMAIAYAVIAADRSKNK